MQDYNAINAKIGAMRGRLLTYRDYAELAGSESVNAAVKRLSKGGKSYAVFQTATDIRRSMVERNLVLSVTDDFTGISRFITDNGVREYISAYFLRIDVGILKLIISSVNDKRDIAYSLMELNRLFARKQKLDIERLAASKSLDAIVDNLRGTMFHKALVSARNGDNADVMRMEIALDRLYYANLWKRTGDNLSKANKAVARAVHGAEIDIHNIINIYRLKNIYNAAPEVIERYLIPMGYKLDKGLLAAMAEARGYALGNLINGSVYGKVFAGFISADGTVGTGSGGLDGAYYQGMDRICRRLAMDKPSTIANIVYYLFQKQREVKNIISLMEGIRYEKPSNVIMENLMTVRN